MINFTTEIKDAYGEPLKLDETRKLTLGRACVEALGQGVPNEEQESGEKKVKRFRLAMKIADSEASGMPVELTAEEIVIAKKRLDKVYINAIVVGRCYELLEPSKKAEAEDEKN